MPLIRVSRGLIATKCKRAFATKALRSQEAVSMYRIEDEYTDTPQYPEIQDLSHRARLGRLNAKVSEDLKNVGTVEEKIFKLNMPRYYGWKMLMLTPQQLVTGLLEGLPLAQTLTHTHLVPQPGLDHLYPLHQVAAASLAQQLRTRVEDIISTQHKGLRRRFEFTDSKSSLQLLEDKQISKHILKQINRVIMNSIAQSVPHLIESKTDFDPRLEAFWFTSMKRPVHLRESKKKNPYDRINKSVQYIDEPVLTLRNDLPLEPLIPYSEIEETSMDVPDYKYAPKCGGLFTEFRHGTNIPGFWTGDSSEFGLLSYHTREFMVDRPYKSLESAEILHSYGIIASFGWLFAQASYQGFNAFNDITYPLVTQTVISNGQHWSFYAYQLNTTTFHKDCHGVNNKRNICYYTEPSKLYEDIDDNGKVIGFNEDVLKTLIQFYLNMPKARENIDMKPYLNKDIQVIADIKDTERRVWLEDHYKYLVANRPRQRLDPEEYLWEKIYKIKFKTRPLDAKRRPFELEINPYQRRLDEHAPEYISRYARPGGYMDKRVKFVKNYYP